MVWFVIKYISVRMSMRWYRESDGIMIYSIIILWIEMVLSYMILEYIYIEREYGIYGERR